MRILVVEDEVDVCNVTAAMITHLGHVAAKSYSAADAFQQLRNGNIDLLVTDICMPDMDGAALVQLVVDDGRCYGLGRGGHACALDDRKERHRVIQAIQPERPEVGD